MRTARCIVLVAVASLLLGSTGCMIYKSGPLADVSKFSQVAAQATSAKPLCVAFDFRHYANGQPAAGQPQVRVRKFRDHLLNILREMKSVNVTEGPAAADGYRLQVSLREEEIFNEGLVFLSGATLMLVPASAKVGYECKAELRDEKNQLVGSYKLEDTLNVVMQLFLFPCIPFNRDWSWRITDNLYRQLAIKVAGDLAKAETRK